MSSVIDCCEDGHLCVCEKPVIVTKSAAETNAAIGIPETLHLNVDASKEDEEEIPLVTKFEMSLFRLKEQVNNVRSQSKARIRKARQRNTQQECESAKENFEFYEPEKEDTDTMKHWKTKSGQEKLGSDFRKENSQITMHQSGSVQENSVNITVNESVECCNSKYLTENSKDRRETDKAFNINKKGSLKQSKLKSLSKGQSKESLNSSCSMSMTESACGFKPIIKPIIKTAEIEPPLILSTPDVGNHRKRRANSETKQNVKKRKRRANSETKHNVKERKCKDLQKNQSEEMKDRSTPVDRLNMSLPTPKRNRHKMDSEDEKVDGDSHDVFTAGLSPVKYYLVEDIEGEHEYEKDEKHGESDNRVPETDIRVPGTNNQVPDTDIRVPETSLNPKVEPVKKIKNKRPRITMEECDGMKQICDNKAVRKDSDTVDSWKSVKDTSDRPKNSKKHRINDKFYSENKDSPKLKRSKSSSLTTNKTKELLNSPCSISASSSTSASCSLDTKNKPIDTDHNFIPSTPKVTNLRKTQVKLESKQNVKKQRSKSVENRNRLPIDKSPPEDALNMSLPTPKSTCTSPMESEEEKDSTDSDEDFPVGITPLKYSNSLNERDLVWVKWKKWPYLPALVKHIYKRKKRVSLVFFHPEDKPIKPMTMKMGSNIIPYFDPRRIDIMNSAHSLPTEQSQLFNACVERTEYFLMKKALKELDDDWSFFKEEDLEGADGELDDKIEEKPEVLNQEEPVKKIRELSRKGLLRKERMKEKWKDLTNFLLSNECKEYLIKIFRRETKSQIHSIFMEGSVKDKKALKYRGFGPIDDEDQIEKILLTYHDWLEEVNKSPYLNKNNYVFNVWVPEAIVFGLRKLRRYSTKKAWEMFHKGVRYTKEERQLLHEELIRKSPKREPKEEAPILKRKLILKLS